MSILVDTGVFYAFYNKKDIHHLDSICILVHAMEGRWGRIYVTNLIVAETVTLLRYRISLNAAISFLEALRKSGITILFMDETAYNEAIKILKKYSDKQLSFADAFSINVLSELKINYLATYDERSFKGIINKIIGNKYAKTLTKKELERILAKIQLKY